MRKLLEARTELSNLLSYMDGKAGAEELIAKVLKDPALLQSLAVAPKPADGSRRKCSQRKARKIPRHRNTTYISAACRSRSNQWLKRIQVQETAAAGQTLEAQRVRGTSAEGVQAQDRPGAGRPSRTRCKTLAAQALEGTALISDDAIKTIEAIIAAIDRKLTEQINLIIHHEDFQQLEGAWRGLHHLVNNTETDETLKIRVMNISKKDLHKTLKKFKGTAWDQSPLFKKLYEEEYGQFGGAAVRLPGRRLLLRPQPAGRGIAAARWPRSPPRRTPRSSPAASPTLVADGLLAGAGQSRAT